MTPTVAIVYLLVGMSYVLTLRLLPRNIITRGLLGFAAAATLFMGGALFAWWLYGPSPVRTLLVQVMHFPAIATHVLLMHHILASYAQTLRTGE